DDTGAYFIIRDHNGQAHAVIPALLEPYASICCWHWRTGQIQCPLLSCPSCPASRGASAPIARRSVFPPIRALPTAAGQGAARGGRLDSRDKARRFSY